jgi:hypothetical protein
MPASSIERGEREVAAVIGGWGARIRTWEWRYQKPLPYRLATPQHGCEMQRGYYTPAVCDQYGMTFGRVSAEAIDDGKLQPCGSTG